MMVAWHFYDSLACNRENSTPAGLVGDYISLVFCSAPFHKNTPCFTVTLHTPASTPPDWLYEADSLVSVCSEWQRSWEREEKESLREGPATGTLRKITKNNLRTWRRTRYNPTLKFVQYFQDCNGGLRVDISQLHVQYMRPCAMLFTARRYRLVFTYWRWWPFVVFGIDCGFIFDYDLQIAGFSPLICYDICKSCEPKMDSSSETIKYFVSFSLYNRTPRPAGSAVQMAGVPFYTKSMNHKKDFETSILR